MAFPNVAWPAHAGMVTVAELLRRVSPGAARAGSAPDLLDTEPSSVQVPVETLLRREGHNTGSFQRPNQPPREPSRPRLTKRQVKKVAVAAGAVVTAGTMVAGALWVSQPFSGDPAATGVGQGSYPSQGALDGSAPTDGSLPTLGAPGAGAAASLLPPAFPDLAAASAGGTIPLTGGGAAAPAAANGAPSPAVSPAGGGGAPPAAQRSGGGSAPAERSGPITSTVGTVTDAAEPVTKTLDSAVGGVVGLLG